MDIVALLETLVKEIIAAEENFFKNPKDFYELELASGGIMRSFLSVPCDRYFTMERKIKRFIETTLLVYEVPKSKIEMGINFVSQFDFKYLADLTIKNMLKYLEENALRLEE